jgi:hypothetical protein
MRNPFTEFEIKSQKNYPLIKQLLTCVSEFKGEKHDEYGLKLYNCMVNLCNREKNVDLLFVAQG